jgi:hypothetical protein
VAIGKGTHLESLTLHQVSEGIPHGLVIINDEDDLLNKRRRRLNYHQIAFTVGRKPAYTALLNHDSPAADLIQDKTGLHYGSVRLRP